MKTAILLGAGSSMSAGFPSTQDLTDLVLSGEGVWRHTDTSYFTDGANPPDEKTRLANSMARRLCAKAERYYLTRAGRRPNYEDLYYLARQAFDEEAGEMENPAVLSFAQHLTADTSRLISEAGTNWVETLSETCNYIADIVWHRLCQTATQTDHLMPLIDACRSGYITSISTLCHDGHVEKSLSGEGISLADGFSEPQHGVRYWNNDLSSKGKTPFLKLHGSVDWFHLRPDSSETDFDVRIGIPLNGDHNHTKTAGDVRQRSLDGRPLLLIGTFNKISEYSQEIFRELHYRFRSTLNESDQLVVCGYSFGDKGINSEIVEWYRAKRERRFLVIDPDPIELVTNARGAIRNRWDEWEKSGSIKLISKPLECVDADEVLQAICCSCEH